jgi:hypothetical protein
LRIVDTIILLLAIVQIQCEALELAQSKIRVQEELLAIAACRVQDREDIILELEAILGPIRTTKNRPNFVFF